jgi:hypothetical protein
VSIPNPPRRRRSYRRFSDERIWREFYATCIIATGSKGLVTFNDIPHEAALLADSAYIEYRERFPVRDPELNDEAAALEPETDGDTSQVQTKKGVQ